MDVAETLNICKVPYVIALLIDPKGGSASLTFIGTAIVPRVEDEKRRSVRFLACNRGFRNNCHEFKRRC